MPCNHDSCILSALRSLRNGIELGARIRGTHCLVMILLYRRHLPLQKNLEFLLKASKEHALNLGMFAFSFKLLQCALMNKTGTSKPQAALIAGLVFGLLVWGRKKSNINYQIVLYLLSRDLVGLANHYFDEHPPPAVVSKLAYPLGASLIWGVVMGLHAKTPDALQDGLRSSMDFLYEDDDHWRANGTYMWLRDPRGLAIHLPRISLKTKLLLGLIGVPLAAWEVGVYQREEFAQEQRKLAVSNSPSLPYFGRRWGAESDYQIQCSLQTGDLIFLNVDTSALHAREALKRHLLQRFNNSPHWDSVGVVLKTHEGPVVHFGNAKIPYSALLANHRTLNVGVRRLVTGDDVRAKIADVVLNAPSSHAPGWTSLMWALLRKTDQGDKVHERFAAALTKAKLEQIYKDNVNLLESVSERRRARAAEVIEPKLREIKAEAEDILVDQVKPAFDTPGAAFVFETYGAAGLLPVISDVKTHETEILEILDDLPTARLNRFFFARHGVSEYTNAKTTGYLGSISFQRLSQGQRGSSVF